jgi:GNAT superfamily N-acetyltransferase
VDTPPVVPLIRRAEAGDAAQIASFNAAMAIETEHMTLDPARLLKGVESVLVDSTKGFYLLAIIDGRVAGQLMITYEWSDWRNGVFWWIESVYVLPEFRKRGVFTRLYRFIEQEAERDDSVCGIRLYVERENIRAQATYQKMGMHETVYKMYETDFVLKRE